MPPSQVTPWDYFTKDQGKAQHTPGKFVLQHSKAGSQFCLRCPDVSWSLLKSAMTSTLPVYPVCGILSTIVHVWPKCKAVLPRIHYNSIFPVEAVEAGCHMDSCWNTMETSIGLCCQILRINSYLFLCLMHFRVFRTKNVKQLTTDLWEDN